MGVAAARALPPQVAVDPVALLQNERELGRLHFVQTMNRPGADRLLKTHLCQIDGVEVEVQVYVKRSAEEDLTGIGKALAKLYQAIDPEGHPNLLPPQHWLESEKPVARNAGTPAFLIRQHLKTSLYDRLNTRPFLSEVEKTWVVYQLMRALEDLHELGIVHGDVKSEAIYITTFGWVVLSDFAPYKPTYLPDDDPADFNFYFQTQNRSCYLAPERFFSSSPEAKSRKDDDLQAKQHVDDLMNSKLGAENLLAEAAAGTGPKTGVGGGGYLTRDGQLRYYMDVFSAGCVIAEVYSDVGPPLDLPALLRLRNADNQEDIDALLNLTRLSKYPGVDDLVREMCGLEPSQRKSLRDYRALMRKRRLCPESFDEFLYPFFKEMVQHAPSPDEKLALVCAHYDELLIQLTGTKDPEGVAFFESCADIGHGIGAKLEPSLVGAQDWAVQSQRENVALFRVPSVQSMEVDVSTDTILEPMEVGLEDMLAETQALIDALEDPKRSPARMPRLARSSIASGKGLSFEFTVGPDPERLKQGSVIIIIQLLCSFLRHLRRPHARVICLLLLTRLSAFIPSELRLQRVVPFVLHMLDDERPVVRAAALRALNAILQSCDALLPSDAKIFPKYICPALAGVATDTVEIVRVAFAECLAGFAESARRFIDLSQAMAQRSDLDDSDAVDGAESVESVERDSDPRRPRVRSFDDGNELDEWTQKQMKAQVMRREMTGVVAREDETTEREEPQTPRSRERRKRGSISIATDLMDKDLHELQELITRWIVMIASPLQNVSSDGYDASLAKRALLRDISRFCLFLGQEKMLSVMLPHLIHFLNDKDWQLRFSFCQHIPAVCALVGCVATGSYILPLLETALLDSEERVVARALRSIAALVELGFLQRHVVLEKAQDTAPLLLHPGNWVRHAAIVLQVAVADHLGMPDAYVFSLPILRPFLSYDLLGIPITRKNVEAALRDPLSREVYWEAVRLRHKDLETVLAQADDGSRADETDEDEAMEMTAEDKDSLERLSKYIDIAAQAVRKGTPADTATLGRKSIIVEQGHRERAFILGPIRAEGFTLREQPERLLVPSQSVANILCEGSYHTVELPHLQRLHRRLQAPITPRRTRWMRGSLQNADLRAAGGAGFSFEDEDSLAQKANLLSPSGEATIWQVKGGPDHLSGVDLEDVKSLMDLRLAVGGHAGRMLSMNKQQADQMLLGALGVEDVANLQHTPTGAQGGSGALQSVDSSRLAGIAARAQEGANDDPGAVARRIRALAVPPLPPVLGVLRHPRDGSPYSGVSDSSAVQTGLTSPGRPRNTSNASSSSSTATALWKPSTPGVLVSSMAEHDGAVNALCVSQDQRFFVSCGDDGVARIWETRALDRIVAPRSRAAYSKQGGALTGGTMLDNSHSVATASTNGTLHVWRVDFQLSGRGAASGGPGASTPGGTDPMDDPAVRSRNLRVDGASQVRAVDAREGAVTSVAHYNSSVASVLLFATQAGTIHSWDLRSAVEPFQLPLPEETGFLSTLAIGSDRHWALGGTSHGYLALWDLRFGLLVNLWRHSSHRQIYKLASASTSVASGTSDAASERPFCYVAAGANEVSCFDLITGRCRQCFRVLPPLSAEALRSPDKQDLHETGEESGFESGSLLNNDSLPSLEEVRIPCHPRAPLLVSGTPSYHYGHDATRPERYEPTMRAMLGKISTSESYLVTGGSDCTIRYWDFLSAQRCGVVSGLSPGQPKPSYDATGDEVKLFRCRDTAVPQPETVMPSKLPVQQQKGPLPPPTGHRDAILDLKQLKLPFRCVLSASRDGVVKAWR